MKLSTGQKKELKGMLTFLVASIIVWLLASLVLHFPWNHTLILTALSVVISIIQTAFIVFRRNKEDEWCVSRFKFSESDYDIFYIEQARRLSVFIKKEDYRHHTEMVRDTNGWRNSAENSLRRYLYVDGR